jgi:hypothetical protein
MKALRKPLDQGTEDGFCGLYSCTNCLRLLFPRQMNDDLSNEIFTVLCMSLTRWPSIVWEGTEHEDMRVILEAARRHLESKQIEFTWEALFEHHRVYGWKDFQDHLKGKIAGDDAFAIVGLSQPWEHWTVAHRFTKGHIILTDSCHVKEIPLAQCGLSGEYGAKYQFDYKDTFVLSRP